MIQLVAEYHQLTGAQRQAGVGVSVIVNKLHFKHSVSQLLHHGFNLPAEQFVRRLVLQKCNNVE